MLFSTIFADPAECWIETVNNDSIFTVGDTLNLRINSDTHNDTLIAYSFYITFDSEVFEPLFSEDGMPFTPFDFGQGWAHIDNQANCIGPDSLGICDVYGESDNGIPGFQLDYLRLGSNNSHIVGEGLVAMFSLLVRDIPNNEDQSTDIVIDDGSNNRNSTYIICVII